MTPELRRRAEEVFDEALSVELSRRSAFLDAACTDDPPGVRTEVESLLAHYEQAAAGGFLNEPLRKGVYGLDSPPVGDPTPEELPHAPPGYEILGELGRGGMGVVYKARQTNLNRLVALKMIRGEGHSQPEEMLVRFRAEAEAVARFQHANLVQIYEVGRDQGRAYCTLEYVEGGSLAQKLAGKPLPAAQAAALAEMLAGAMHYAHRHGIIHRDLKPANILLTNEGVPKITDFGMANRLDEQAGAAGFRTQSGAILGTPCYMAPEQAEGRTAEIGARSDVYALGAILYEMLTGRPPFQGVSVLDTLVQVRSHDPVPPSRLQPKLPRDLETICLYCLRKEPRKRYESAAALAEDLRRFRAGEPIRARSVGLWERCWKWARRRPTAAAMVGVCLLALVGVAAGSIWNYRQVQAARTVTLVQNLTAARTTDAPRLVEELQPYRRWAVPLLEQRLAEAPPHSQQRLNVQLALLPDHPGLAGELYDRLLAAARLDDVPVLRDALADHRQRLTPDLWQVLDDPAQSADRRFRAAVALAFYVPADTEPARSHWQPHALFLTNQMLAAVNANPSHYLLLLKAFRPIRDVLFAPLGQTFRDGRRPDAERQSATNLLKDFLDDAVPPRLDILADLLEDSDPGQYAKLWGLVERHREAMVDLLHKKLDQTPLPRWPDEPLPPEWSQPDPALERVLVNAQGMLAERFAICQTMPLDDFIEVAKKLRASGYRPTRLRPYGAGKVVRVAAIWAHDGRDWKMSLGQSAEAIARQDTDWKRQGYCPADVAGYLAETAAGGSEEQYAGLWYKAVAGDEDSVMIAGSAGGAAHLAATYKFANKGYKRWTQQVITGRDGQPRISSVWRKPIPPPPAFFIDNSEALLKRLPSPDSFLGDVSVRWTGTSQKPARTDKGAQAKPSDRRTPRGGSWLYSGLWHSTGAIPPPWEMRLLTGMDPARQREYGLVLTEQGYRPETLSVSGGGEGEPAVAASLWRRPVVSDEEKDPWAKRQANVAVTLCRLNKPDRVWPLLRQSPEQHRRMYLVHRLIPLGLDPDMLLSRLKDPTTEASERRALVLALGEPIAGTPAPRLPADLELLLRKTYETDPDAGYHSAAGWLLRRCKGAALLRQLDAGLVAKEPILDRKGYVNGRRWYVNGQFQTLALVPGPTTFRMGSPSHEPRREESETLRQVRIPYSFAIATTEVTNQQYEPFYRYKYRYPRQPIKYSWPYSMTPNQPAILLTWNDAAEYCQWLSQKEGIAKDQWCYPKLEELIALHQKNQNVEPDLKKTGYRLPTDAEWEWACRAGTVTSRPYGSAEEMLTRYAWYRGTIEHRGNTEEQVGEVGLLKPNDLGLFDALGNAWEWCQDRDALVPGQPGSSPNRVLRGGAFDSRPKDLRSAAWYRAPQNERTHMAGLRVARTLPAQEQGASQGR